MNKYQIAYQVMCELEEIDGNNNSLGIKFQHGSKNSITVVKNILANKVAMDALNK